MRGEPGQDAVAIGGSPGSQDHTTWSGLLYPGVREVTSDHGGCADDPVIGCLVRPACGTVPAHHGRLAAGDGQIGARLVGQCGIDLDGRHLFVAEAVREQGRVVPGPGADLQYLVILVRIQRFEHGQQHAGLRG